MIGLSDFPINRIADDNDLWLVDIASLFGYLIFVKMKNARPNVPFGTGG